LNDSSHQIKEAKRDNQNVEKSAAPSPELMDAISTVQAEEKGSE